MGDSTAFFFFCSWALREWWQLVAVILLDVLTALSPVCASGFIGVDHCRGGRDGVDQALSPGQNESRRSRDDLLNFHPP